MDDSEISLTQGQFARPNRRGPRGHGQGPAIDCASPGLRTDGRTDGRTYGRTDGRTDGRTGGRTDGTTDGRTDGRTDLVCEALLVVKGLDAGVELVKLLVQGLAPGVDRAFGVQHLGAAGGTRGGDSAGDIIYRDIR